MPTFPRMTTLESPTITRVVSRRWLLAAMPVVAVGIAGCGSTTMQLIVVALVLPRLTLLARSGRYQALRVIAAGTIAVAAVGWLAARIGFPNPVAAAADRVGVIAIPVVVALWLVALLVAGSDRQRQSAAPRPAGAVDVPASLV